MPTLTVTVSDAVARYLDSYLATPKAARLGHSTRAAALAARVEAMAARDAALAKHAAKVRRVKSEGADSGETFARRTPLFPAHTFTAPETERDVARWAEHAPRGDRTVRRVRAAGAAPVAVDPDAVE